MKRRIFVVDDHPVMRKGFRFLMDQEPDLEVCGEADSAPAALEAIPEAAPDLVIVDLSLGGMGGLELIKTLQTQQPDLPLLVVSTHDESLYGERALMAGARGYVMKSEVDTVVVEAVRRVLRGGVYLSDQMSTKILLQYRRTENLPTEDADDPGAASVQQLSDRELEVFELIGQGYSTQQIADALMISPKTVDSHRGRIKDKLAVPSTNRLLQRATLWVDRQP